MLGVPGEIVEINHAVSEKGNVDGLFGCQGKIGHRLGRDV